MRYQFFTHPCLVSAMLGMVENKRGLNNYVSYDLAAMVRTHIRKASVSRHTSAARVGGNRAFRGCGRINAATRHE